MEGTARLQNGVLTGEAVAPMPRTVNTPINIEYGSEEGVGSAHISIPKVVFTPRGLQPQYLIPTLRGKLAEVSGEASAEFDFSFGDGAPVRSYGTTTLKNMDIGTLVGPASKALENFEYKELEALIDGPLDREMTLRMLFGGKNPGLLAGTAFEFDVTVTGELANIARDFSGALYPQNI